MIEETLQHLPKPVQAAASEIAIIVEDLPSKEMLGEMGMGAAYDLTGLYHGIPLTEKSISDQPYGPDMIWLFRLPILAEWAERGEVALGRLVAHVLVHELAHHFGWSDDDIAEIDRWWE